MIEQPHRVPRARTLRITRALLPVVPLIGAIGCLGEASPDDGGEAVTSAQQALLGVPGITHYYDATPRNRVDVCYNGLYQWDGTLSGTEEVPIFNGSWTSDMSSVQTEIDIMEEAIEDEWGANSGLDFQFHGNCPASIPAQYVPIVLVTGHELGNIGGACRWGLGSRRDPNPNLEGDDPEHQGIIFVYDDGSEIVRNQLRAVAVHELGHGIGFAHEMDRADWTADPAYDCTPGGQTDTSVFYTTDYDPDSIMHYCRDVDDDGVADAYTSDVNGHLTELDKAGVQMLYGFPDPWQSPGRHFCAGDGQSAYDGQLLIGRFNNDGRSDVLCYEQSNGTFTADYADTAGHFTNNDWTWSGSPFCRQGRLVVADADGNGRDDLVCNNIQTGRMSVDLSNFWGQFWGENWSQNNRWFCASGNLVAGKFNSDNRTDLLCANAYGISVDLANSNGQYTNTDWSRNGPFCQSYPDEVLHVGDVNGDGLDDLICHNDSTGVVTVDLARSNGQFPQDDYVGPGGFCTGSSESSLVVDLDGDGRVELVCHDRVTGHISVALGVADGSFTEVKYQGPFARFCGDFTSAAYPGHFRGDARGDLLCFSHTGDLGAQYSTLPRIGESCEGSACFADWRDTSCGASCTSETQSDRAMCEVYLDCYVNNNCDPSTCGGPDDVCGVNVLGGGTAPKTIADQVYACLTAP